MCNHKIIKFPHPIPPLVYPLPKSQVALAKQLLAEQCATDLEELESAMKLGAWKQQFLLVLFAALGCCCRCRCRCRCRRRRRCCCCCCCLRCHGVLFCQFSIKCVYCNMFVVFRIWI